MSFDLLFFIREQATVVIFLGEEGKKENISFLSSPSFNTGNSVNFSQKGSQKTKQDE